MDLNTELLQLGTIGILFAFFIKEYFRSQKIKKNGNGNEKMLEQLKLLNSNHLHTIQETMEDICKEMNEGNNRVVTAITNMHTETARLLGEIKGRLDK